MSYYVLQNFYLSKEDNRIKKSFKKSAYKKNFVYEISKLVDEAKNYCNV